MRLVQVPGAALLAAVFALPAVPALAEGGPVFGVTSIDAARTTTLTASEAARRDCLAGPLAGRGVARTTWTAPADGVLTAHLRGGSAGDWDLAAHDVRGQRLAGSAAIASNEIVQVGLRRGATVSLQACRRSGPASVPLRLQFVRVDADAFEQAGRSRIQMVRVTVPSARAFEQLEDTGLDVTHDSGQGYARVVLYSAGDRSTLRELGLPFRVEVADLDAHMRRVRAADRAYAERVGVSALPTNRTTYRVFEDYQRELKDMVARHPDLVQPVELRNKSFQGRDIQAVEIAADVRNGDDGRPVFTLGAVHHAREWPAAETAMEFAWDLLKNHGTDARLAQILRDVRVVVMPITNPDGFLSSRTAMDPDEGLLTPVFPFGGNFAYRRKNCNPIVHQNTALPCEAAIGVDNNRNYATDWGGPGSSTTPTDQSYRGSGAFSEPETRAVQELSSKLNSPVHISAHNVAAKVLRPPGLKADGFAPDEEGLKLLGQLMAGPTGYANEYGWQLYDTTGTTKDWGYDALGQYSYTVELGPAGGDFHGPYKTHVIDEYQGRKVGSKVFKGLREAYINAALFTRNESETSRLTGTAPAGATLRITKSFTTETYPVCLVADPQPFGVPDPTGNQYCTAPGQVQRIPEKVDFSMTVPASGTYTWWMNPSTRPFEAKAGRTETYTLTCEVGGKVLQTEQVLLARGETKPLDLACGG